LQSGVNGAVKAISKVHSPTRFKVNR
jgi:hypothetical protein